MTEATTSYRMLAEARFQVTFDKVEQEDFLAWCKRYKIDPKKIPTIKVDKQYVAVDPESISDKDIAEEYESRRLSGDWLPRVYRLLAENDCEGAMDELYRQFFAFGLAPPYAERRLVDRITGYKELFHAES